MQLQKIGAQIAIEPVGYGSHVSDPDITVLANGNIVVVWAEHLQAPTGEFEDTDGAVFGRVLTPYGAQIGDVFQINEAHSFLQTKPQVVAQPTGGFVAAWVNESRFGHHATDTDTFLRFFDALGNGIANTFVDVVRDTPASQTESSFEQQIVQEIVPLTYKRFAVLLEDGDAHVYNASGTLVARPTGGADDMVQLNNGNIVRAVTVSDTSHGSSGYAVKMTLTDDQFGAPKGIPGVYAPLSFYVDGTWAAKKANSNLELVALQNGGFALAFIEEAANGASAFRLDILSEQGALSYSATPVPLPFAYDAPAMEFDMIALSGGGIAVAMSNENAASGSRSIDLLLFGEDGSLQSAQRDIGIDPSGSQAFPTLTERPDGSIALAFTDSSAAGGLPLQMAFFQVVGDQANLQGTNAADILVGTAGDDEILGLLGNDQIDGGKGADLLRGGDGADVVRGGSGRDTLRGGADNDLLEGGGGADGLGGNLGNDSLYGRGGNDFLGGGQGNDILDGGKDDDVLKGGEGSDTLIGGRGEDLFIFVNGQVGQDVVTDFDATEDSIRISLRGNDASNLSVTGFGGNTHITLGTVDVVLSGVVLSETDIVFQFV